MLTLPKEPMNEKFLTVEDVAKRFQVNTTTVYRLAQKGVLPGLKVGGQWRFSPTMLDVWVARHVGGRDIGEKENG